MTDNDIIKALECCSKRSFHHYPCNDCPLLREVCFGGASLMKPSLDLINRQKTEIERLKAFEKNVYETVKELRNKIKAEAVKGFANEVTSVCYQEFGSELEIAHTFAEIVTETLKHWRENDV